MKCRISACSLPRAWPAAGAHHLGALAAGRPAGLPRLPLAGPVSLSAPLLWLTGAERWLLLAGLAVALGGLAGQGLLRGYEPAPPRPLPAPWAVRGSLLGALASALLLVTALGDPQLAVRLAQPPALGLPRDATAAIAAVELACFALAALALRLRQAGWGATALSVVVAAEGLRSHSEGMIPAAGAALTICHLLPALLWAGMLLYTLRAAYAWRGYPAAVGGLVRRYATAAAWLFAIVVITGLFSALLLVPLGSLLTTRYGVLLLLKGGLVGIAACLAIGGRIWLARPARVAAGPALATRLELTGLAAVLAVTAVLTVITPPAPPVYRAAGTPAPAAPHLRTPAAG